MLGLVRAKPQFASVPMAARVWATRQGAAELTVSVGQLLASALEGEIPRPQNYNSLEKKYGSSAWVFVCAMRKATDLAGGPLRVMARQADGSLKPTPADHPLAVLLRDVNPWMTTGELLQMTSIYLDLTGNAFWLLLRDAGGRVLEIYPVNPFAVRIVGSKRAVVDHYIVWHQGAEYRFPAWQVGQRGAMIHFRLANPTSDGDSMFPSVWGVGPLEASWNLVVTDEETVKWNRNLMRNDGRPSGMLMSEEDVTPDQASEAAAMFREVFAGPQGAGKVLVLGGKLKYQRIADTPRELDFVRSTEQTREQIIMAFGLNSAVLGLAQGDIGKRMEQHREYWEGTIQSRSRAHLLPPLNEYLAAEYGPGIVVVQDFAGIRALQENEEIRSQFVRTYWETGVPMQELNRRFGLDFQPWPGWELSYVSAAMLPAGSLEEPEDVAVLEAAGFRQRLARELRREFPEEAA